jgi:hypothetical protein
MKSWLQGNSKDGNKLSKQKSLLKKYWTFCLETQVDFFPLSFMQMGRYAIWLSQNDIGSWDSATNYINAIWQLNLKMQQPDPMSEPDAWDLLRKRYKAEVIVVQKSEPKTRIYLAQYEALALDALDDLTDYRIEEMASDALMMFTAVRVGHIAPKATKRPDHVLRWEHVVFKPSIDNCQQIFLHVPSTKVRGTTVYKPWWTAFGRVEDEGLFHLCPLRWFVLHYEKNFLGNNAAQASDPVFKTNRGRMLNRTAYTAALKSRLQRSSDSKLNAPDYNVNNNSGISWRTAALSQLVGKIADSRAANFADHRSIETTRGFYAEDSISERAALSNIIAAFK